MSNYLRKMLKDAAAEGFTFYCIYDGVTDYSGSNVGEAYRALTAFCQMELILRDAHGNHMGWALVIDGPKPDEVIADCNSGSWIDSWLEANVL